MIQRIGLRTRRIDKNVISAGKPWMRYIVQIIGVLRPAFPGGEFTQNPSEIRNGFYCPKVAGSAWIRTVTRLGAAWLERDRQVYPVQVGDIICHLYDTDESRAPVRIAAGATPVS